MKNLLLYASILMFTVSCTHNDEMSIDTSEPGLYFSTKSVLPGGVSSGVKIMKGVAADGSSCLAIRIIKLNNYTPSSISLSIPDSKYGELSKEISSERSLSIEDDNIVSKKIDNIEYYEYYYHAPHEIPSSNNEDSIANTAIAINIKINDQILSFERPIHIVRTPIIFAHGLSSDSATFKPMIDYIHEKKIYTHNALYALDYSATSLSSYSVNDKVIPDAINRVKSRMLTCGYQCESVNIVGHSMGGILTRIYMQGATYRNDIYKIITIDAPHSGTQLADMGINLAERYPESILGILSSCGAIVDLQVDSPATLNDLNGPTLNKVKVPTHVISGAFGEKMHITQLIIDKQYVQALLVFLVGNITEQIYNEPNDIVVPYSSQIGGIKRAITEYNDQWHCSVHTTKKSADRVAEIMNKPSTSTLYFSMSGFAPSILTYNSSKNNVEIVEIAQTENSNTFVLPETVSETLFIAVDENNKFIDAQYNNNGSTIYNITNDKVKKVYLLGRCASTPNKLFSSHTN